MYIFTHTYIYDKLNLQTWENYEKKIKIKSVITEVKRVNQVNDIWNKYILDKCSAQ